jgi:hypothetical protein
MDEMKQASEIDNALREAAKQRDKLLSELPALSSARQAVLTGFLVKEFAVEAALREVMTKRDQLLNRSREIPAAVESALHQQLPRPEPACDEDRQWRAADWRINASMWRGIFRSRPGAILMVCAVITAAVLCFGRWGTPSRHNVENFLHNPRSAGVFLESEVGLDRAELFARKAVIGPFNLNTSEPASLQAAFVAKSGLYSADGAEIPLGLRLDLPLTAILSDEGLSRTP